MSNDIPQTNDPEVMRREIERTRGNLSQNVNALGEAVDPSNVARRQAEKVQDRVKGAGRGLKERIMGSDDDQSYGRYETTQGYGYADTRYASYDDGNSGPSVGQRASDMGHRASDAASDVGHRASDAASEAGDRLRDAADTARVNLERAPGAARRQAQGNPLAAGLIALGAGWLLGSLLPVSERERQLAVRAKETAQEKGQPLLDEAKHVAQEAADNLKAPVTEAAESLKGSAQDSVEKVKGEGQHAAADVKDQAKGAKDNVQQQRKN